MENESPTPDKVEKTPEKVDVVYTFTEAITALMKGGKISKLEWNNQAIYGFLNNGMLQLHNPKSTKKIDDNWAVSEGDMIGKDWIVL